MSLATAAAESEPPDTSDWDCKWCLVNSGTSSEFESGVGYVSDDSYRFGQFTGLGSAGMFGIVKGESAYRGEDGRFWFLSAEVLGSDRIRAGAAIGRQGRYDLYLDYEQMPNLIQDTARTPLSGYGALQLPANWVRAGTTDAMSALAASLNPVNLETERRRLTLGGRLRPGRNWTTALRYKREEKTGRQSIGAPIGGSLIARFPFLTQSTVIQQPTDFVTHRLDATASHQTEKSHLSAGYQGSYFNQEQESLSWQNPFTDLTGSGADSGRLALPPDNQFHQLFTTFAYRLSPTTRATARAAIGRLEQDEALLPYSINSGLQGALPRASADAEVNTHNYQLKLSSRPARRLSLNASYTYSDRQNDTLRSEYDYVITDAVLSPVSRMNRNYSFERTSIDLNGSYRFNSMARVSFGYGRKDVERTLQVIENSVEDSYWAALSFAPHETVDVSIRYTSSDRNADEVVTDPETVPPENSLMRAYNIADRERQSLAATVSYTPNAVVGFGLTLDYSDDDYVETEIGLTGSENRTITADVSITPGSKMRLHAFATHQDIEATQSGSQTFSTPTWSADTKDSFGTVGMTIDYQPDTDRFSLGLDYIFSESFADIDIVDSLDTALPFPDQSTKLHRAELYVSFIASETLSWRLGWLYEDYGTTDWSKDGVDADTVSNVLLLGESSFNYKVHMPVVSVSYQF